MVHERNTGGNTGHPSGVVAYDDLLIKHSYWRWPSKDIGGNAIDYFVLVEGMSFADAMLLLEQAQ